MSRLGKTAVVWMLLPLMLTGCWDIKDIQDINYLTCIGIDKVDKEYRVYVQMIDFSSVAKTESGKPNQPVPVWVGVGKGTTIIGAFNDLYRTAQLRSFYGQINTIVLSENIMRTGLKDAKEMLDRYYEIRYTPWLFGTKQPIDELFAVTPFFNLSPLMSMLHQPQEIYKQQSLIAPLTLREFVSEMREPGNSAFIPSLSIESRNWKAKEQPKRMLDVDGVFVFQDQKYTKWFPVQSVWGLRWVEPKTERSPILIESEGEPQVALSLEKPDIKIVPKIKNDRVTFNVNVKLSGYISEALQPLPESELKQKVEEYIQRQIKDTYDEGLSSGVDMLRLDHALYRQKNREWKRVHEQGGLGLKSGSIQIEVEAKIIHSGKLKY